MTKTQPNWLDRAVGFVSPAAGLRRQRARVATELLQRHYEGASVGRRTSSWNRSSSDPNVAVGQALASLRNAARDLTRNNPYAESALSTIVDHAVGWGIVAKTKSKPFQEVWDAWANSTACDADGRHDLYGLQKLAMRTVAQSGELLVRRRFRRPEDNLPIPLQIQLLEPDFLDTSKDVLRTASGGRIVNGVEFNAIGQRVAYWLFREHPGSNLATLASDRIPADGVRHIFKGERPGQVRAVSWFAPVLLRFKDFDELEDAVLMKQKVAACLAVVVSDIDGTGSPLGTVDTTQPTVDMIEPGAIINGGAGRNIEVVQPPTVSEYPQYAETVLRAIATGLGVTYEDLTGDYTDLPFSAARMSRIRHWARVEDWRWRLLIPQFLDPVWQWASTAAGVIGVESAAVQWTPPPMPMIEPDKEGLAYQRNIRTGIMTLSEAIRERGYDPDALLAEYAADNAKLDALKITLDSDPRKVTQQGLTQTEPSAAPPAQKEAAA